VAPHGIWAHICGIDLVRTGPELRIAEDQVGRQHARVQDLPRAVDIVEKGIDRFDALHQPLGQSAPFIRQEYPRHDVERNDTLARVAFAIDRKGNAQLAERCLGTFLSAAEFLRRRVRDPLPEWGEFRARDHATAHPHNLVKRSCYPHLVRNASVRLRFHA
jgi:hypothetical protein